MTAAGTSGWQPFGVGQAKLRRERHRKVRQLAADFVSRADRACDDWIIPADRVTVAVAVACLRRGVALLDDASRLAESGKRTGANVLIRTACEFWLLGSWLAFSTTNEPLEMLDRKREAEMGKLANANAHQLEDAFLEELRNRRERVDEAWGVSDRPMDLSIARVATNLIPQSLAGRHIDQVDSPDDFREVYDLIYRGHSTFEAHPWSVGTDLVDIADGLRVPPAEVVFNSADAVATMVAQLSLLGHWIDLALGMERPWWVEIKTRAFGLCQAPSRPQD